MKRRTHKIFILFVSFAFVFLAIWYVKCLHSEKEKYSKVEKEICDIGEYVINVLDSYLKGFGTKEEPIKKLEDVGTSFAGKDGTDYFVLSSDILRARFYLIDNDISGIKEIRKEIGYKD